MADTLVFTDADSLLLDTGALQLRRPAPAPEPEPSTAEIDYFEYDTSTFWDKYYNKSNTKNRGTSTGAARSGTKGAYHNGPDATENYSSTESWSNPSSGKLPNYPETGKNFVAHFNMPEFPDHSQAWLLFGGQTSGVGDEDRYQVELIKDSATQSDFRVRRDIDRNRVVLAADYDMVHNYQTNTWYKILVRWHSGGGFDCYLLLDSTGELLSHISTTDSTYTGKGRIGMRIDKYAALYCDDFELVSDAYADSLLA